MTTDMRTDTAMRQLVRNLFGRNDKTVYVVSGAPGSGKTTHVMQNKCSDDIVLDLDLLAAALQGQAVAHPNYEPVMDAVLAAREAVYQIIESRKGKWQRAFVITSSPDKRSVDELAKRLDAEVVQMQASQSECIDRILADTTRINTERDVELVKKWFANKSIQ